MIIIELGLTCNHAANHAGADAYHGLNMKGFNRAPDVIVFNLWADPDTTFYIVVHKHKLQVIWFLDHDLFNRNWYEQLLAVYKACHQVYTANKLYLKQRCFLPISLSPVTMKRNFLFCVLAAVMLLSLSGMFIYFMNFLV